MNEKIVYGIFGIPGSGKSTQGRLLEANKNLHLIHISTGTVFNDIKYNKKDMDEYKELIPMMKARDDDAKLYPDDITARELDKYVNEFIEKRIYDPDSQILLFDGYPRNLNQVNLMSGKYKMTKLAFLQLPQEVGLDRIVNKRLEEEGRPEDQNVDARRKSIKEHEQGIIQIYYHFKDIKATSSLGLYPEIRLVDGNQPVEVVYKELESFFKP